MELLKCFASVFLILEIRTVLTQKSVTCQYKEKGGAHKGPYFTIAHATPNTKFQILFCKCASDRNCFGSVYCNMSKAKCETKASSCTTFFIPEINIRNYIAYGIEVRQKSQNISRFTVIDKFIVTVAYLIKNCFPDHKPYVRIPTINPLKVEWWMPWFDLYLSAGFKMRIRNKGTGNTLSTEKCVREKRYEDCTRIRGCSCIIKGTLTPCQTYEICVTQVLTINAGVSKDAETTCKDLVTHAGVIKRPGYPDAQPQVTTKKTLFSWRMDRGDEKDSHGSLPWPWFYKFTLYIEKETNILISNSTTRPSFLVHVPSGTKKCILSVRKCVPCKCGPEITSQFDNCAAYSVATPEQPGNRKDQRSLIIWSVVVVVSVVLLVLILVVFIVRKIKPQRPTPDEPELYVHDIFPDYVAPRPADGYVDEI